MDADALQNNPKNKMNPENNPQDLAVVEIPSSSSSRKKTMGRKKIELKKIEDTNSRQVTFSKRRNGLLKKAKELSILCDSEIGVVVFSNTGKLYEFASSSMDQILERYISKTNIPNAEKMITDEGQLSQVDVNALETEIAQLLNEQGKLMGKDLGEMSLEELKNLESQLTGGLLTVKEKKELSLKKALEISKLHEQKLEQENKSLRVKFAEFRKQSRLKGIQGQRNPEREGNSDTTLSLVHTVDDTGLLQKKKKRARTESTSNDFEGPVTEE